MLEKWGKETAGDITVFINSCCQHSSSVLPVPGGIIRPSSKERNTEWGSADDHGLPF